MTVSDLWIQAAGRTAVGFGLAGDSQTTRSGGSGGGGWQIIDRPRRGATTEWIDYGPWQMTVSLILDGYGGGLGPNSGPISCEPAIAEVESWETPVPGSSPPLPPILTVTGPVPHNELRWVAQQIVWKEAIRDPASKVRWQQNLDMVLWQYLPATITTQAASPSIPAAATPAAAARNNPTPWLNGTNQRTLGVPTAAGGSTYTVKFLDTLTGIASRLYGDYGYWTLLANANGIRDPNNIQIGQILTVPAKTASPPPLKAITISGNNFRNLTG